MRTGFDALIVGAGPAGSSAAILLARVGWSVALIEKQRFPRRKVCGECIAASNLPLLEALGIGPAFEADAGPELRQVALMRGERTVVADLPAAAHDKYRWGRALGRETLDTLLLAQARASGAHILQPWSVQAIDGTPGDWRCEVRAMDSQETLTLRAPIVIDAHGSWELLPSSRPRRRVAHRASDLIAFKANFREAKLDEGLLPVLSFDGGYGGMVVAGGGVTTVACCVRRDRLDAWRHASPGLRAGEVVEAMLQRACVGVRVALQAASRDGPWLAAGPLDPGIRLTDDDGLFRIGNAAGEAHPIIGEGMSMALQSAWLLCLQLLDDERRKDAPVQVWQCEAGRRYAAQWRRQFEPRLRLAAAFANVAMRPAGAAPLLALARAWPGLLTLGARWGGKVRCAADPVDLT
ncbi:NAD(P)/FAD-dependent oxidoreductase [Rhodoferax sp. UBA5149]|uniref:NAD(P)/FAD-dependent oxidoreductase n=1 Tax=Rhodoferax sp. UBA5149 TaxID=1947379 RepID=UPI0025E3B2A9|nr:FAD-dependent monooxygenase [Rhodoferax sp. UBA5149]